MTTNDARIDACLESIPYPKNTMRLGLHRLKAFFSQHPIHQFTCPVIIVGGTNGKGSCIQYLTQIMLASGYRVGSYTSPHLQSITERISLNNKPIKHDYLLNTLNKILPDAKRHQCTYFEVLTLAACAVFQNEPLDIILFEVGLGGRLDAVNALDPDVSIITTIDLDHQHILGNTIEKIALEKAAIARRDKPLIYASACPPNNLIKTIEKTQAIPYIAGKHWSYEMNQNNSWTFKQGKKEIKLPALRLPIASAAAAITALHCLSDRFSINEKNIIKGLELACLPGRFQIIQDQEKPTWILDVAHNAQSAQYLSTQLLAHKALHPHTTYHAIIACMEQKSHQAILKPLIPLIDVWYVSEFDHPPSCTAKTLYNTLVALGCKHKIHLTKSLKEAQTKALAESDHHDTLLAFGSFITVSVITSCLT
jgi:dihydrofolate synthase / folylpolyglutamate synthase